VRGVESDRAWRGEMVARQRSSKNTKARIEDSVEATIICSMIFPTFYNTVGL